MSRDLAHLAFLFSSVLYESAVFYARDERMDGRSAHVHTIHPNAEPIPRLAK